MSAAPATDPRPIVIPVDRVRLAGDLAVPDGAVGILAFAQGTGSGRHSPRNRLVAERLAQAGLATLLLDLLIAGEQAEDLPTRELPFDIALLAERFPQGSTGSPSRTPPRRCRSAVSGPAPALPWP